MSGNQWGYSALVEVDGHKIRYDTGASPDMVLKNAKALHVDLSDVEEVVLSHNHWDHVGGLMALRREFSKANPRAMSRVHVGAGIFEPRLNDAGEDDNGLTGPVPRPNAEKSWNPGLSLVTAQGRVEDNVPEEKPLLAVVGGLHLFNASDQTLDWTGAKLKSYRLENLLAGHCTGIEATYRLRSLTGLTRKTAVVSAAGSSFTLGLGIDPRLLAH